MWYVSQHVTTLIFGQVMRRKISKATVNDELVRVLQVVAVT